MYSRTIVNIDVYMPVWVDLVGARKHIEKQVKIGII